MIVAQPRSDWKGADGGGGVCSDVLGLLQSLGTCHDGSQYCSCNRKGCPFLLGPVTDCHVLVQCLVCLTVLGGGRGTSSFWSATASLVASDVCSVTCMASLIGELQTVTCRPMQ
jgi:hypothetical protein